MADNNALTVGNGSGGNLALREKTLGGNSVKVQRVTLVAGDTISVSTISQTTTGAVVIAANQSRVYAQITPRNGDVYLAGSTGALTSASTRCTVLNGETWDTAYYAGDIAIAAVTGTVTVDIEQVT